MTMVKKLSAVSLTVFLSFATIDVLAQKKRTEPALPQAYVDTTLIPPTGNTISLDAGGNLQTALNTAQPGDLITLAAGATYTGSFTLPVKPGSRYITVQTVGFSTPGRLTPSGALAKIVTPSTEPAVSAAPRAHHFRFIGVELYATGSIDTLVLLGSSSETNVAKQPDHIIFDRCYIHGDANAGGKRGVSFQGSHLAVIDSYLSDWKGEGYDTQAICGWNGPGPFKIANNYLEGAGENVMFGGADTVKTNLTPSDIEIRNNTFFKPLSWKLGDPSYAGVQWSVKNLLELKHAQRVLIENNVFENCWTQAQNGTAIVLTPRNQQGTNPWAVVQDITFRRNTVRYVEEGMRILGHDSPDVSLTTKRVLFENNLWQHIGRPADTSWVYAILSGVEDLTINHETADQQASSIIFAAGSPKNLRFTFTNNIGRHNLYGIIGDNVGVGNAAIAYYFPGADIRRNILIGADPAYYPADNFFPATIAAVGFENYPTNLRLASTSPYYNQGTDGTSPGVQ